MGSSNSTWGWSILTARWDISLLPLRIEILQRLLTSFPTLPRSPTSQIKWTGSAAGYYSKGLASAVNLVAVTRITRPEKRGTAIGSLSVSGAQAAPKIRNRIS